MVSASYLVSDVSIHKIDSLLKTGLNSTGSSVKFCIRQVDGDHFTSSSRISCTIMFITKRFPGPHGVQNEASSDLVLPKPHTGI